MSNYPYTRNITNATTLGVTDSHISINCGAAITITLPKLSDLYAFSGAPNGVLEDGIKFIDEAGNAATFNITFVPQFGDTIMGGASIVINTNGGQGIFMPMGNNTWGYQPLLTASASLGTDTENIQTPTGSTMTLPNTPIFIYGVFKNGQRLALGIDYTVSGNIITFINALAADLIVVTYKY